MDSREKEFRQYLPGLRDGMPETFQKLAEIFQYQVFELYKPELFESKSDEGEKYLTPHMMNDGVEGYLIPYMMNDAVEDYLILRNCRITGEYLRHKECETTATITCENDGCVLSYVLSVRQGEDNAFTLRFSDIEERIQCYQYHNIGHFWVEGQEQWRQLVYIAGTIYEKYDYLGEAFCNEAEKELKDLITFPPFRLWSPIHESLEGKYPATYEGIDCMERLAGEAGDQNYIRLLRLYRRYPNGALEKWLSQSLLSSNRQKLYEKIWEKVRLASEPYPKRDYGAKLNAEMEEKRREAEDMLVQQGFEGDYPEYYRGKTQVTVAEEHPFTMMEYDDFVFQIQFMVSECKGHVNMGRNCGFFRGRGRKSRIVRKIR